MRFLFTTMQYEEAEFYGRVATQLGQLGHHSVHVVMSRHSAGELGAMGHESRLLPELAAGLPGIDVASEVDRIESTYDIASIRDVYITDPACEGRPEAWCVERTVRYVVALERIFDEVRPEVIFPEVGTDTMRTMVHQIGLRRDIPVVFIFYTIFPEPLRVYFDSPHLPIVPPEEVRPLSEEERAEVEGWIAEFTGRGKAIFPHRRASVTAGKLREFARHVRVKATTDRDNPYLHPAEFVTNTLSQRSRALAARPLYSKPDPKRPFIYFPLHLVNDFKVKRVIPHCVDQEYLIGQLADALPQGWDVVVKEHPVSIGRNPLSMLRRLTERENVRLVSPYESSHELSNQARAVTVISSTVGLEALLYARPVLTMGQPFYSGYGITVDVDSFREIRPKLAEVLRFEPDRERILQFLHACMRACRPGAPMSVDNSDENAARLARTLDQAARARVGVPAG